MNNEIRDVLKRSIRQLNGVGQARAQLFNRLNMFTIEDVVTHFPREYEDRSRLKNIFQLQDGETCAFEGVVASPVNERIVRKGMTIQKIQIRDSTGLIVATWFNQGFLKRVFRPGQTYVFYGKISRKFRSLEVQNPVYEKVDAGEMKNTCRIVPLYASTAKLTQNVIRGAIRNALELVEGKFEEDIPQWIRSRYKLSEINYSIQNIHFPRSDEDFKNARYRLVFEELLLLQLGLMNIKNSFTGSSRGICFAASSEVKRLVESLPFKLTNAQNKVLEEIENNMESARVMNRLVQGDVGSGKTIIAVLALYKAVKSGYQAALMAPTEILADQHYRSVSELLAQSDVRLAMLTGSQTKKQKNEIVESIKLGKIDIVIGTHALLEDSVEFDRLGMVVTDEQHRFGVRQRAVLSRKGENPDVLVMTATPIPRTLALILYGDLDISIIDELPPGRKPIETYVVDNSKRERINNFIRNKVAQGRQVYIVCPLVEESETVDARSAVELAEKIAAQDFKDMKVGLIHGKMKAVEKDNIMSGFISGNIDVLVSTTVIEVGVNVPNATIMVIENAERFGLAQLHQLRGRVGRGKHQSYCILYNQGKNEIAAERMKIMQKTNDGFIISEKDLELRGPGEFFGTMQHGLPDLKIANLYRDMDILKLAQEAAKKLLEDDSKIESCENARLKLRIKERFESRMKELSLN